MIMRALARAAELKMRIALWLALAQLPMAQIGLCWPSLMSLSAIVIVYQLIYAIHSVQTLSLIMGLEDLTGSINNLCSVVESIN